jgi:hypothetical protein
MWSQQSVPLMSIVHILLLVLVKNAKMFARHSHLAKEISSAQCLKEDSKELFLASALRVMPLLVEIIAKKVLNGLVHFNQPSATIFLSSVCGVCLLPTQ